MSDPILNLHSASANRKSTPEKRLQKPRNGATPSKMAQGFSGDAGTRRRHVGVAFGRTALRGFRASGSPDRANPVLWPAKASARSPKQNAERELDHYASNLEMIEDHGSRKHQDEPFDTER